ncbi:MULTISPECIES: hypothetical protein [Chryseobacterium]|uniref:hypothetical protein n=1 Tax=Chryseobacterium TaxID=59732 RepID=UPI001958F983|nr:MULTISPECIES: hypothetical protein [Chryseobacterium]MBM7419692.1 hypothetical protein [Chryseobacterium sp. JUb44]MDH6209625.1 hypothetical protein [Chryseobacterium sp. BIGb0186]WSO08382.1 hypothetical protein VUJ64_11130 [Chryseobacterium scophthalmum]
MEAIINFKELYYFNNYHSYVTKCPFISVLNFLNKRICNKNLTVDAFIVSLHLDLPKLYSGSIFKAYLSFSTPFDILNCNSLEEGQELIIHSDTLVKTNLNKEIRIYKFFKENNTRIYLQEDELSSILDFYQNFRVMIDKYCCDRNLINKELKKFLNYCKILYISQIKKRGAKNKYFVQKLNDILKLHFESGSDKLDCIMDKYILAEKLCVSLLFLENVIKVEYSLSIEKYICKFKIKISKKRLIFSDDFISHIATDLGLYSTSYRRYFVEFERKNVDDYRTMMKERLTR